MRFLDGDTLRAALPFPALVDALRTAFREGAEVPLRHHHQIHKGGQHMGTLLLMPAWAEGGYLGVKTVTQFPGNPSAGLLSIMGTYQLMDASTGRPLAIMDGGMLTQHRTAAASVLAATYLARPESQRLLVVGTGQLAPYVARAYAALFDLNDICIWGRNLEKAERLAQALRDEGYPADATPDLQAASEAANIISCVTLSETPLVLGKWLQPGTHLDLIGGFTPAMRETDDEAIARAMVYVDTREGALKEAGDLVQPIKKGIITTDDVRGDLFQLCRGQAPTRLSDTSITLFKSVGTAIEDLAAAVMAYQATHNG